MNCEILCEVSCFSCVDTRGCKITVKGTDHEGRVIRPSDWAERLSSMLSTFGADRRLVYNEKIRPETIDGEKSLTIDASLAKDHPEVFMDIVSFVCTNNMKIFTEIKK